MTKSKKRIKRLVPERTVFRGVVTMDERGPDFFYDERFFPNIKTEPNPYDGKVLECYDAELRLLTPGHVKKRGKKGTSK
jgi:hypothetical protein